MPLAPGEIVLDRYVIEGLVGIGGMGEVYRARHHKLGMPVAIKAITGQLSEDLVARFDREAMLLARVRHPNVVQILDVGHTKEGAPCIAMEFLEGESLETLLSRRRALPWVNVRAIGLAILDGLEATHAAGIVHRDLKPANVFITRGNPEGLKLVDFGIAHAVAADATKYTRTGMQVGTPAYMAPEQIVVAATDARTDIYAVGLLLYETATGALPFGDDPNAALRRFKEAIPPPSTPPGYPPVPPAGVAAILAALAVEPERRPQSAGALAVLLRGRAGTELGTAPVAGAAPGAPPPVPARHATSASATGVHATRAGSQPMPPPVPQPVPAPGWDDGSGAFDASAYGTHAGGGHATGVGATTIVGPKAQALVAARIPVSRMSREEQRSLAQLAAPAKAYHLGGGNWFSVVRADSPQEAAFVANNLGLALQQRYGDTCKVLWTLAPDDFALTPASLSGSAPLPPEITEILLALNPG
jgi:hypothetical protein